MNRIRWYGPTLVLLLTVIAVMVLGPWTARRITWAQTDEQVQLDREALGNSDFLETLSGSFRRVADSVKHSVVSIEVLSRREGRGARPDLFRQWPFMPDPREQPEEEQEQENFPWDPPQQRGNGSGWVYDEQGHIITNNHVIARADEIRVRFSDGSSYTAEVVGTDERTDVAVLKVDGDNLHPAKLAAEPVEQGEIVFAFGSPFRFDFSVSQGIVSAKGRQLGILGRAGYENFIQTDAAINPGNSGGPLTNIRGEVVGVNTAIASRTGTYNGLGFAIPAAMVQDVADQLINEGEVRRGYLGIYIRDLDDVARETYQREGFEGEGGVLVLDPIEGSPAADAGIQTGDIITAVNDEAVEGTDDLRNLIAGYKPGAVVELTVFRGGETITREVTLTELPNEGQLSRGGGGSDDPAGPTNEQAVRTLRMLGVESVQTFTPGLAERNDLEHLPGVLVREVRPGSLAAAQGMRPGMIITGVMGTAVENAEQLTEQIDQFGPGDALRMRVAEWDAAAGTYRTQLIFLKLPNE